MTRALKSILLTLLLAGIEIGLDMASQGVDVTHVSLDWIHSPPWAERRDSAVEDALKRIRKEIERETDNP